MLDRLVYIFMAIVLFGLIVAFTFKSLSTGKIEKCFPKNNDYSSELLEKDDCIKNWVKGLAAHFDDTKYIEFAKFARIEDLPSNKVTVSVYSGKMQNNGKAKFKDVQVMNIEEFFHNQTLVDSVNKYGISKLLVNWYKGRIDLIDLYINPIEK